MNKAKRNHHVNPKLYLKGFATTDDERFIWVYKRGEQYNPGPGKITNNPYKGSIKNAGVEKDFYADSIDGGKKRGMKVLKIAWSCSKNRLIEFLKNFALVK